MMKPLLLILASIWLSGCYSAEYRDASGNKKYADLVGSEYYTLEKLILHGVTYDSNYKQVIDEYVVTNMPGIGGPEVVMRTILKRGTVFRVKEVLECTSCLYSSIKLLVDLEGSGIHRTVQIRLLGIGGVDMFEGSEESVKLNVTLFAKTAKK